MISKERLIEAYSKETILNEFEKLLSNPVVKEYLENGKISEVIKIYTEFKVKNEILTRRGLNGFNPEENLLQELKPKEKVLVI